MSSDSKVKGKAALVTGASSGLGVDFAKDLAGRGCNLVLVARREERLMKVAQEIERDQDVQVDIITADLAHEAERQRLYDQLKQQGKPIDVLINNAGFGAYGDFLDVPWERENQMLQLDVVALAHLTKLFAQDMRQRGSGYVLLVSSIGAYQPSPSYASYSAAKSYVLYLGEALAYEWKGSGVSCTVLSPGVTRTEFLEVSGQERNWFHNLTMMESDKVARIGINAMLKGKPSKVAGLMNAITAWSARITPRQVSAAISAQAMKS